MLYNQLGIILFMEKTFTIFYSWQSDLPKHTNEKAIRLSINSAINKIEEDSESFKLVLDEATRDSPGSPNIPNTIFNKIAKADLFVCDLTTINSTSDNIRKVPNPNVLIELGYAIANLGWERILMLFNTNYGNFPEDLPFDIDRHRASKFSVKGREDKNGKGGLTSLLKVAVTEIIEKQPVKPFDKVLNKSKIKHESDVKNLRWIMGCINIQIFDQFLTRMPNILLMNIFHYHDWFDAVYRSNEFYIYDKKLKDILSRFKKNWNDTLSHHKHFVPHVEFVSYKFDIPNDIHRSAESRKDFDLLSKSHEKLSAEFRELLMYVRENYLEVDLKDTSEKAIENYREYNSEQ